MTESNEMFTFMTSPLFSIQFPYKQMLCSMKLLIEQTAHNYNQFKEI
jgi:hypothetical protein